MPGFRKGFSEDHYVEICARVKDVGGDGPFDAKGILW